MKHVLFIVTSAENIGLAKLKTGYEFSEVANPYLELTLAVIAIDFASISGGAPPEYAYKETDVACKEFRESIGFKRLNFSHKLSNVNIDAYDAIYFPGGLGPMVDMVDHAEVKKAIAQCFEAGKPVAAVCHGPVALLNVQLTSGLMLLHGKNVTSFSEEEEAIERNILGESIPFILEKRLTEQGAVYSKAKPFKSNVVVDGNLITGQNPASAIGVAREMIRLMA